MIRRAAAPFSERRLPNSDYPTPLTAVRIAPPSKSGCAAFRVSLHSPIPHPASL